MIRFAAATVVTVVLAAGCSNRSPVGPTSPSPGPGAGGPGTGLLQIHHISVGQGDAAILITPMGQTMMFDNGDVGQCGAVVDYLHRCGVSRLDYHVASHYHADHIGCSRSVFGAFPVDVGLDRGGSYASATFAAYQESLGMARRSAFPGAVFTLDEQTANPVFARVVAAGEGSGDENDRSLVVVVSYGSFDAEFGGDLTAALDGPAGLLAGRIESYKVHHHCSRGSTSTEWLAATTPKVGIISVGAGNPYGHPAGDCLERLHAAGVKTYWTNTGAGPPPQAGWDVVSGTTVIEVQPGGAAFTLRWAGGMETYASW